MTHKAYIEWERFGYTYVFLHSFTFEKNLLDVYRCTSFIKKIIFFLSSDGCVISKINLTFFLAVMKFGLYLFCSRLQDKLRGTTYVTYFN